MQLLPLSKRKDHRLAHNCGGKLSSMIGNCTNHDYIKKGKQKTQPARAAMAETEANSISPSPHTTHTLTLTTARFTIL